MLTGPVVAPPQERRIADRRAIHRHSPIIGTGTKMTIIWRTIFAVGLAALAITLALMQYTDRSKGRTYRSHVLGVCEARDRQALGDIAREKSLAALQAHAPDPVLRAESVLHTRSVQQLQSYLIDCAKQLG